MFDDLQAAQFDSLREEYDELLLLVTESPLPGMGWFDSYTYRASDLFSDANLGTIPVTQQKIHGPITAKNEDELYGVVSVWKSIDPSESSKQTFYAELTQTKPQADGDAEWWDFPIGPESPIRKGNLSFQLPEDGVRVQYASDDGARQRWAPPVAVTVIKKWHPLRVNLGVPSATLVLSSYEPYEVDEGLETLFDVYVEAMLGLAGAAGELISLARSAADAYRAILDDEGMADPDVMTGSGAPSSFDPNAHDRPEGGWARRAPSYVLSVPVEFESDESHDVVVRGLWDFERPDGSTGPARLEVPMMVGPE